MRKYINESTALWTIFVLASCMLLMCLLFVGSARSAGARSAQPTAAEYMQAQQDQLAAQDALANKLAALERELLAAEGRNDSLRAQNMDLRGENTELGKAQLEVMEGLNLQYKGRYYATAYCCERYPHICGGNGVTASGTAPTPGITIAADWGDLPPGTCVYIEGVGIRRVEDSGSAIRGKKIDVAIDTHANALRWPGLGYHHVWVLDAELLPE